jgi:uncharacterized protein (DUF433 family)
VKESGMKMKEALKNGVGIFSLSEAATYARMSKNTLSYWIFGDKNHEPLRAPKINPKEGRFLTFYDFVEALAIHDLRQGLAPYIGPGKASLQKIRAAIKNAKKNYDIEYPFADKDHKTFLIGKEIYIQLKGETNPTGITKNVEGQIGAKTLLENYMERMIWKGQQPIGYIPYKYSNNQKIEIKMDPNIYFGAPIVGKTGYTAETLWRAAIDEGDKDKAAKNYGVDREEIEAACEYWLSLNTAA